MSSAPAGLYSRRGRICVYHFTGFFSHRTDSAAADLNYQIGAASRAYLRYQWDHVPPASERPVVESRASSVLLGFSGELLPLVTAEVSVGYDHLSAPRAGSGGTTYSGTVFTASLRKQFTPADSVTLLGRRGTYPSGFEQNAFYVATGAGLEADLGLPLSLMVHGDIGWQRNAYRVLAAGSSLPSRVMTTPRAISAPCTATGEACRKTTARR